MERRRSREEGGPGISQRRPVRTDAAQLASRATNTPHAPFYFYINLVSEPTGAKQRGSRAGGGREPGLSAPSGARRSQINPPAARLTQTNLQEPLMRLMPDGGGVISSVFSPCDTLIQLCVCVCARVHRKN